MFMMLHDGDGYLGCHFARLRLAVMPWPSSASKRPHYEAGQAAMLLDVAESIA